LLDLQFATGVDLHGRQRLAVPRLLPGQQAAAWTPYSRDNLARVPDPGGADIRYRACHHLADSGGPLDLPGGTRPFLAPAGGAGAVRTWGWLAALWRRIPGRLAGPGRRGPSPGSPTRPDRDLRGESGCAGNHPGTRQGL